MTTIFIAQASSAHDLDTEGAREGDLVGNTEEIPVNRCRAIDCQNVSVMQQKEHCSSPESKVV
jgi:hypothetical protein